MTMVVGLVESDRGKDGPSFGESELVESIFLAADQRASCNLREG